MGLIPRAGSTPVLGICFFKSFGDDNMEIIVTGEWIWLIFIFAFGSCIGSFLNVVIYRIPREKSIVTPPSACPECNKGIKFYDNIPLVSWVLLGGKCRYCKAKISPSLRS